MFPAVAFALAQVAVAGGSTVWNYFAGKQNLAEQKTRLSENKAFQERLIGQQETNGLNQIADAAANDAAGLAARGIAGSFADLAVRNNQGARTDLLNQQVSNQRAQLAMTTKAAEAELQAQNSQLDADAFTSALGIGMTAGSTMMKAGLFKESSPVVDSLIPKAKSFGKSPFGLGGLPEN